MKTRYRNPWGKETVTPRPEFFEHNGPTVAGPYRGVSVVKNPAGSWDYILAGCAITQRAGFGKDWQDEADAILDGTRPVCDAVAAHLRACGHIALTYSEAGAIDRCEVDGYAVPARTSPDFARMVAHYSRAV